MNTLPSTHFNFRLGDDAFLTKVRATGGIAAVVCGYAEVPALLFEEKTE